MSDFPNLGKYGYQINMQLGCNREGGRITWKGKNLVTQKTVVIKQFCFAIANSSWSGYQAYEKEIKILQRLNHTGIPKYLDCIETENGFCLIQEYISAFNLNNFRSLTIVEVKKIALELLEILIYLQQQNPPIIHRDIKPENILLDDELNVYLIDFGFASLGSKEVSGSSVFKGTPGFIAPEQIVKPTLASDLYGLGVTIICLLSNKNITEIRDLASVDNPYHLNLKPLLPELNRDFRRWLEKMTDVRSSKRFSDALAAKDALLSVKLTNSSSEILLINKPQINNSARIKVIVGTFAIFALSSTAVWSISFAERYVESTTINIAIAILAGIVVGITQTGAIAITKLDSQSQLQGAILGIGVPIFLVAASAFIWGTAEAVDITVAIVIAQTTILSYFWWQLPVLKTRFRLRLGFLVTAIVTGISLSLKFI